MSKKKKYNKYNDTIHIITEHSYNKLAKIGFRFSIIEESYIYKFVIKRWNKYPVVFGRIKVNEFTGEVKVDVLRENGEFYTPFYSNKYGTYNPHLMNYINKRIDAEFKKLKIKFKKENNDESCT